MASSLISRPALSRRELLSLATGQVAFGDFELNLETGDLSKKGRLLSLPPIPNRLLCLLVERAGQTVSLPALGNALWGSNHYGDVELGLRTAVKTLRQTLRDDARRPRYVETVRCRGYRFCARLRTPANALPLGPTLDIKTRLLDPAIEVPLFQTARLIAIHLAKRVAERAPNQNGPNPVALHEDGDEHWTLDATADGKSIHFSLVDVKTRWVVWSHSCDWPSIDTKLPVSVDPSTALKVARLVEQELHGVRPPHSAPLRVLEPAPPIASSR